MVTLDTLNDEPALAWNVYAVARWDGFPQGQIASVQAVTKEEALTLARQYNHGYVMVEGPHL